MRVFAVRSSKVEEWCENGLIRMDREVLGGGDQRAYRNIP